ncbi:MAG TPA: hypothetical protein VD902_13370 [Symbiobacteriaceae bacterium]|nr:hypothetical protein [Symbiobacteriaceae bacterium]
MADQNITRGALGTTGAQAGTLAPAQGLDIQRLGMEVANELGVDPNNLAAYGLSEQQVRQYETQLHSRTQRGGSR